MHRCRWNLGPEGRDFAHEILAGVHQIAELLERQRLFARVLVHQVSRLSALLPKRRIKECPSDTLATCTVQKPCIKVAEFMLHVISGRKV